MIQIACVGFADSEKRLPWVLMVKWAEVAAKPEPVAAQAKRWSIFGSVFGSGTDALVVFTPSGRRGRFPVGSSLLQAARSLGVDIDSVCGGRAA